MRGRAAKDPNGRRVVIEPTVDQLLNRSPEDIAREAEVWIALNPGKPLPSYLRPKNRRSTLPSWKRARSASNDAPTVPANQPLTGERAVKPSAQNSAIFISYRRHDEAGSAGRISDELRRSFGDDQVFCDARIEAGVDFVRVLEDQLGKCRVILAVIGRYWLNARDDAGRRRLDQPNDYVRMEIERGLSRGIPVVPILVDGTRMPSAAELPETMDSFARRNGFPISNSRFGFDMAALIGALKRALAG